MKCKKKDCGGKLRITHTYATDDGKYQRAACPECRMVYTLTTVMQEAPARGEGARAKARSAKVPKTD